MIWTLKKKTEFYSPLSDNSQNQQIQNIQNTAHKRSTSNKIFMTYYLISIVKFSGYIFFQLIRIVDNLILLR